MPRYAALAALALLAGCYDFAGDLGRIGFVSNLQLHPGEKWTPASPIAAGVPAELAAAELIGADHDDPPEVDAVARGRGVTAWPTEHGIALSAPGRARATVTWSGEVEDRFTVELAPVREAALVDPIALIDGWDVPEADLAVAPGQVVTLAAVLTDRRGRALGYDPARLDVVATGPLSAWVDDDAVRIEASGPGDITLGYGAPIGQLPVEVAGCQDVERLEVAPVRVTSPEGDIIGALAIAWLDDDTRLLGCPVDWTWSDGLERDDEGRADVLILTGPAAGAVKVEARLGPLADAARIG